MVHKGMCPRVKSVEFADDGVTLRKVEFHGPVPWTPQSQYGGAPINQPWQGIVPHNTIISDAAHNWPYNIAQSRWTDAERSAAANAQVEAERQERYMACAGSLPASL
jgi:hypothetical protein